MKKRHLKYILLRLFYILFTSILLLTIIIFINRVKIYPTNKEIKSLRFFYYPALKSKEDIIKFQNYIIDNIKHEELKEKNINVLKIIQLKKGLCYDRSLLMQKYFLLNHFSLRPVYLFFGEHTSAFDFLCPKIKSHSLFEIKYKNNWFIIKTNTKMKELETIDQYLNSGYLPRHTRYIRYLNNRNGRFISPFFIPDIYFF
ncbi:MAG: hypothetical protein RL372_432 [Bacteroidota bacterium]|jgi:hypothetical protein